MKRRKFIRVLGSKRHDRFGLRRTKRFSGGQKSLVILGVLALVAVMDFSLSCFNQSSLAAQNTQKVKVSLEVKQSCAISASDTEQSGTMTVGLHEQIGGDSLFKIICNDAEGYVVYAVGNGKGLDGIEVEGNTDLVGTDLANRIATGTATSGEISNWSFKLSEPTGGLTIVDGYDKEAAVPKTRTAVAARATRVTSPEGDSFKASYAMYTNPVQLADKYTGRIKFVLFHPSWANSDGSSTMQNWTGCDSLTEGQLVTLEDTRDGNLYKVAKLKDGRCWMVENLALGGENPIDLTPEDSDVSGNWTLPASTDGYKAGHWDEAYVHIGSETGHLGGYYSWTAATAGTGVMATPKDTEAQDSICPKGWRLPTGGAADSEYSVMAALYGSWENVAAWIEALTAKPVPNFELSGKYNSDGTDGQVGEYGYWWSGTTWGAAGDGANAYALMIQNGQAVGPGNWYNHYNGHSVRCISEQ